MLNKFFLFQIFFAMIFMTSNSFASEFEKLLCPHTPNCVSSVATGGQYIAPLKINPDAQLENVVKTLKDVIETIPRIEVVEESSTELLLVATTYLGFKDDLCFLIDLPNHLLYFSSRSRVGYYDFGMNRSRLEKITNALLLHSEFHIE